MMQSQEKWLDRLDEVIEQNLNNSNFALSHPSSALATSPAQLNRKVKKLKGLPKKMYLRKKRVTIQH